MPSSPILIIGHGYIGAALAKSLHQSNHSVAAVNRSGSPAPSYPLFSGDLGDRDSLENVKRLLGDQTPSTLVHCASSGRGGVDAYRSVFICGIENLINTFPHTPIIFTSSTSVYAQTDGSVVTESAETAPEQEAGRLLLEAEGLVRSSGGTNLRLAGIYGPGRSIYLKRILNGTATIESGKTSRFLNQIHRDDAVGAIRHVLSQQDKDAGRTYNVADNASLTQRECYEKLAAVLKLPVPPESPPETNKKRAWTHKRVSNAALRKTGWKPRFSSFFDAIESDPELVESMREQIPER